MACAFVQAVAAAPTCQTVSLEPATASASNDSPGPGASVAVPAGTAGSPRQALPRPPPGTPHAPPPPPTPAARPPATPPSTADVVQPDPVDHAAISSLPASS